MLISQTGVPILSDFGLSLALLQSASWATTTSGLTKGTVRWMAKELFVPGNPLPKHDEKSDIWAFGMVVYVRSLDIIYSSPYKVLMRSNKGIAHLEGAVLG